MWGARVFRVIDRISGLTSRIGANDDLPQPQHPHRLVGARSFLADRTGATVIEFALLAMPFLLSVMFIIEMGLLFFANILLEDGVASAARQIRTGQFQTSGAKEADFRKMICDNIKVLMNCDQDHLFFDLRVFNQFGNVSFEDPLADGDIKNGLQFNPGNSGDIVLARVFYSWRTLTPFFGDLIASKGQNYRLINVNFAFRNEPYSF